MNVKAEAFQEYNQAAVIDKLLTSLPEIVRALAAPLANVDKITIVSTGNGDSAAYISSPRIYQDRCPGPRSFRGPFGSSVSELFSNIRQIGDKTKKPKQPLSVLGTEIET